MDHKIKNTENEKKDLAREKKVVEHKSDSDTNFNWRAWNGLLMLNKRTEGVRNWTNWDHPKYSIDDVGQDTEKNPRNLGRLAVT